MKNTQPFITTDWKRELNDIYPHGGLEYKGELVQYQVINFVELLLQAQKERLIKEVESVQKEYSGKGDEVGWGACEIILQKLK